MAFRDVLDLTEAAFCKKTLKRIHRQMYYVYSKCFVRERTKSIYIQNLMCL